MLFNKSSTYVDYIIIQISLETFAYNLFSNFRYLAGRLKIISNSETKGLSTFVGTFALPSLIFLSLVELNWEKVNWAFLLSILVSKAIVFFAVIVITLFIARPINYGRAGLLAIFCTQSNDFAIGYPIGEFLTPFFDTFFFLI